MSRYYFEKHAVDNLDGVLLGQYYGLSYYYYGKGYVNVLFQICDEDEHSVCIYELGLKKIKYEGKVVEVVNQNLLPARNPVIVPKEMNCWSKSNFWVRTNPDKTLSVPIPDLGNTIGTAYPVKEEGSTDSIRTYYFEVETEEPKENESEPLENNYNIC